MSDLEFTADVHRGMRAMVSIQAHVPDDAATAGILGTERAGHGVVIRSDGLIVTIGYLIYEAESVWVGTEEGATVPAYIVANDYESGFGLVRPTLPVGGTQMALGTTEGLSIGDVVLVGSPEQVVEASVVAKQEFAGRWEYVLDEAIFTAPPHPNWAGAALMDAQGRLCGIGSLLLHGMEVADQIEAANMFVPIDLLTPILDELCEQGHRRGAARPWLGFLVEEVEGRLIVVGVYRDYPAYQGGLQPGDIIVRVDDDPVPGLAQLFRRIWSLGSAGIEVPISYLRDGEIYDTTVKSADRTTLMRRGALN